MQNLKKYFRVLDSDYIYRPASGCDDDIPPISRIPYCFLDETHMANSTDNIEYCGLGINDTHTVVETVPLTCPNNNEARDDNSAYCCNFYKNGTLLPNGAERCCSKIQICDYDANGDVDGFCEDIIDIW